MGQESMVNVALFGAGLIASFIAWLLRQQIGVQQQESQRIAQEVDQLAGQISRMVTRQELEDYKRDTAHMIEALRTGIKDDLENIRRNEIKELYDIIRTETRETRNGLREELNSSMTSIREELRSILSHLSATNKV